MRAVLLAFVIGEARVDLVLDHLYLIIADKSSVAAGPPSLAWGSTCLPSIRTTNHALNGCRSFVIGNVLPRIFVLGDSVGDLLFGVYWSRPWSSSA